MDQYSLSRRVRFPVAFLLLAGAGLLSHSGRPEPPASEAGDVRILALRGIVNPVTSTYVKREIGDAARAQAGAVVLEMDTPGGLESSMREIVGQILNSPVPIIAYVSPAGARAASAGMYITIAAHIAAMAPGTNIGAAHPVTLGGGQEKVNQPLEQKILNDAAALARSIANERGRNADWIEQSVRNSVSITAAEALRLGVIDLRSVSLTDLLHQVDGRTVQTSAGKFTLKTANARRIERPMTFPEKVLQVLTDPNIAYILLTIGFIGIIAEFYHPGLILPGAVGALALILGFTALGSLPINGVGVFLLVVGIALLIAEFHIPGFGVLGILGLVTFILGSLMLYRPLRPASPAMPRLSINPGVLVAMSLLVAGFFFGVLRAVWVARRKPVSTGPESLIGATGIAESDLTPKGVVNLKGERWTAEVESSEEIERAPLGLRVIHAGERVEVREVKGVTLKVRRQK